MPIISTGPKLDGMYPIADIIDPQIIAQIVKDGYGYCVHQPFKSFVRVEVVPDSEFYTYARVATNEEAKAWYESFDRLFSYVYLAKLLQTIK